MGWFGGGSTEEPSEKVFGNSDDMQQPTSMMMPPGSAPAGAGGSGLSEFQEFSMALQQQLVVQQVITELSNKAFQKCITSTRDSTLSGKEVACIHAATNKWLDSNEFLVGRLGQKQQQQTGNQFG